MTSRQAAGRRILLLGTHGQSNVGDELLLQTFLHQLGSEHQYEINSYDPSATAHAIDDAFSVQVFDTGSGQWRLPARILRSDVLVFAGGSIVKELTPATQRWRYSTLLMVFLVVTFARRACRKPVLFSNVGVGPLASRRGRFLAKLIVSQASFVATRDRASRDMCLALGLDSDRVQQVPDAVFVNSSESFDVQQHAVRSDQRPLRIALNLNHDVEDERRWEAFLDELGGALEHLAAEREIEIIALPMQSTFKNDNDLIVLRDFLESTPLTATFPVIDDHHDVARVVAGADVLVAERLHAIVIAAIVGVPVVALPYSTKVVELVDELGLADRSFSVEDSFSPTALSEAITDAAALGELEGSRLRSHSRAQQVHLEAYFSSVRSWIADPGVRRQVGQHSVGSS